MIANNFIYTQKRHCVGCNKCILKCPVNANAAIWEDEQNKVLIKDGFCISCGECISVCDHHARDFGDDTDVFFEDLARGESISIIVSPAAKINFPNLKNIFGFLKEKGVRFIYDVSFGADICTWAYIKTITEKGLRSVIAQPCPVVVSYIEKYHPSLIPQLSPVQSPVICLATYLERHRDSDDKIALFSPCIGKKRECIDENTAGHMHYNVTYTKFLDYIARNNIDLSTYEEGEFDDLGGAWGAVFPRPGGLSENIKLYMGEHIWIKEIEGIANIEAYLIQYAEDLINDQPVPLIIDALNCEHGCNLGTGTNKNIRYNQIDYIINKNKAAVAPHRGDKLMKYFAEHLNVADYTRHYTDKSSEYASNLDVDLEPAYIELEKFTQADRTINCFACGYESCHSFVLNYANNHNHKNNCKHYLLNKFKSLSLVDDLTGLKSRYSYSETLKKYTENPSRCMGIAFVDINGLKTANDTLGHIYGDIMITTCGNILKEAFPESVFRVGGDEFIILSQDIGEDCFYQEIDKLRDTFKNAEAVSTSIGCLWTDDVENLQVYIDIADKNMYAVKQAHYRDLRHTKNQQ